jgi:hypothetical protein
VFPPRQTRNALAITTSTSGEIIPLPLRSLCGVNNVREIGRHTIV